VPRITPHSSQDDDAYRSDEQRATAAAADPLPRLRETLIERGLLSLDDDERMVREAREQVVADEDLALAMPEPPPERARRWLHAGDPPHGGAVLPDRYAGWAGVFGD
jgi:TPP-dependent pyruvate/acetoin dehydrogenase alpha subunit